ncbi:MULTISPECIES: phosphatase PAP2 family protein [unclassified Janthinobacterium]|uniref:phosphatase PAP2 family protein n=1 Tax=unclassified Janthinobacterium TaxID=2610881 RepID=UPI0002DFE44D|nr:phosphatase PAP2 family protein [Janthinobacterium sp. CG_23.4]MDH6157754.1 membrane-associated phospholipid phosphatase [Janthinobacterium sp. CG_23.4]
MTWWNGISFAADMSVMGPAGAAIALWLLVSRQWRLVLSWSLWYGGGLALVVLSKLAFMSWGVGSSALDFTGFSGHAMRAGAVFPVLMYVLLQRAEARWRHAGVLVGVAFAVLVGISRVVVHAHSVSEAVSGCVLGLALALGFMWTARGAVNIAVSHALALVSLVLMVVLSFKAEPMPTEQWLQELAKLLSGHEHVFSRDDWKLAHDRRPVP